LIPQTTHSPHDCIILLNDQARLSTKTCATLLLQPLNYAIRIPACPAGPMLCKLNVICMVKELTLDFSIIGGTD